jgi:SSS family solute:Na+ symporter
MTAATLVSKNVYAVLVPRVTEARVTVLAKWLVPVIALISVFFTVRGSETLVTLLLMGYNFVTQLFPALLFSLGRRPLATRAGAYAGIVSGVTIVAWLTLSGRTLARLVPSWPDAVKDLNVGIVAMLVNLTVLLVLSLATRLRQASQRDAGRSTPGLLASR